MPTGRLFSAFESMKKLATAAETPMTLGQKSREAARVFQRDRPDDLQQTRREFLWRSVAGMAASGPTGAKRDTGPAPVEDRDTGIKCTHSLEINKVSRVDHRLTLEPRASHCSTACASASDSVLAWCGSLRQWTITCSRDIGLRRGEIEYCVRYGRDG